MHYTIDEHDKRQAGRSTSMTALRRQSIECIMMTNSICTRWQLLKRLMTNLFTTTVTKTIIDPLIYYSDAYYDKRRTNRVIIVQNAILYWRSDKHRGMTTSIQVMMMTA